MWDLMVQHGARLAVIVLGVGLLGWAVVGDQPAAVDGVFVVLGPVLVVLGCFAERIDEVSGGGFRLRFRSSDVGKLGHEVELARQEQPDPAVLDLPGEDSWDGARYRLGERAIEWLLTQLHGQLYGCEARVFLYDDDVKRLMPAFRPSTARGDAALGWEVGQGVTGVAFLEKRYAFAEGKRTHDGSYGLTETQQARYSDLTAVAAVPLYDRAGGVIGTLSLSSRSPGTKLTSEHGYSEHVALAMQVSVTLIDLLRVTA
jgi:hypothetical protein